MNISVCIATYNGARFIEEQLNSIVRQLSVGDEVIVIDDCSTDDTFEYVNSLSLEYLSNYRNEFHLGVVGTFDKATRMARGDVIIFSDQDDIWYEHKVARLKNAFSFGANLVCHNAKYLYPDSNGVFCKNDDNGNVFGGRLPSSRFLSIVAKNSFPGCCMAIDRTLLELSLEFPKSSLILHDWWIASLASFNCLSIDIIQEPLIYHRRHDSNASSTGNSSQRSKVAIITSRIYLVYKVVIRSIFRKIIGISK